jgi:short-subunit dehydrogenase
MSNHASFAGKTAIVTGATGGVGSALAKKLAEDERMNVAMADLDQERLDQVAAGINGETLPKALDVSDRNAYTAYIDEVEEKYGPLDYLCNVAAIMPINDFDAEDDALTHKIIAVNLEAVVHSTKEAARRMKSRGSGHIINVASGAGWLAGGGVATYVGTKFGVVGYSESVDLELKGSGVHISVVAPAVIKSEMSAGLKDVRGVRAVEPWEVADAIIGVMRKPKFATFVPRAIGAMSLGFSAVPYRLRHFLMSLSKTDKLLLDADRSARKQYEERVAASARDDD